MHGLDHVAHQNRLSGVRAAHKGVVAISLLLACLILNRVAVSLAVLGLMASLVVGWAGVRGRTWLRVTLAEAVFLLLSIGTIALTVAPQAPASGIGFSMAGQWIGVTAEKGVLALHLLTRTLAAASCLSFLALTTPLHDLVALANRYRVPPFLIDIMVLTYRFLWVLAGTLTRMQQAQASRLGTATRCGMLRSAGLIGARLFIRAYRRMERLNDGLVARGFEGTFPMEGRAAKRPAPGLLLAGVVAIGVLTALRWSGLP